MKKILCVLLVVFSVFGLSACAKEDKSVSTDGSTSMEKVIGSLGEAFMEENSDVNFTYNPTGSGSGIKAVLEGRCDIGLSSRALKDEEKNEGLTETVLAYDGIAVIIHPDNNIDDLDLETIGKIFTKEITNWSELGGEDAEIVLIGREAGSGTREGFEAVVDVENKCEYRQELTSTGDVITIVSSNPNAIGYASVASIKDNVKAVTIDGIEATDDTIKDGSYQLQRPFMLITKDDEELTGTAKEFFDYVTSTNANGVIKSAGVVPAN